MTLKDFFYSRQMQQENLMSQENLKSTESPEREYEKSGLYPEEGKPFRILALLGWLAAIVVLLAVAAAVLDLTLLER
jgi:hypothetical protein